MLIVNYGWSANGTFALVFFVGIAMVVVAVTKPAWYAVHFTQTKETINSEDSVRSASEALTMGLGLILASICIYLLGEKFVFQSFIGSMAFSQFFRRPARAFISRRINARSDG